jgi:hypothetical protein
MGRQDWGDSNERGQLLSRRGRVRNTSRTRSAKGRDWQYVGWYSEMLGLAERGYFPIAYADWSLGADRGLPLLAVADATPAPPSYLPMPPPGLLSDPQERLLDTERS